MSKSKHPNRIPFKGVLCYLDVPSDKAPAGSEGHRVILTTEAAEAAIDSLVGMGVGFKPNWDGHDARQKCGFITNAYILGNELWVEGHVFGRDFPEIIEQFNKPDVAMGLSYEMCDVHIPNMRERVWRIARTTFTGAAILLCDKAAYKASHFNLQANAEVFAGKLTFLTEGGFQLERRRRGVRAWARRVMRSVRSGRSARS